MQHECNLFWYWSTWIWQNDESTFLYLTKQIIINRNANEKQVFCHFRVSSFHIASFCHNFSKRPLFCLYKFIHKIPGHHNTEIQERTSHVADGWWNGSLRVGNLWIHAIMIHTHPYSYYCEWMSHLQYSSAQSCKNIITNDIFFEKCLNEFRCWICCCVPLCIDSCKDVQHFCSSCQAFLGTYKRI